MTLRNNDADRFALTLPLPEGRATAGSNELNFQAERFFVHPAELTVGLTGDKGLVEEAYIPRLQTFKLRLGQDVVGTLALMAIMSWEAFTTTDSSTIWLKLTGHSTR